MIRSRDNPQFETLYKLRPLLNELPGNFAKCVLPGELTGIDEPMIKIKGRRAINQYLLKKPTQRSGCCPKNQVTS